MRSLAKPSHPYPTEMPVTVPEWMAWCMVLDFRKCSKKGSVDRSPSWRDKLTAW